MLGSRLAVTVAVVVLVVGGPALLRAAGEKATPAAPQDPVVMPARGAPPADAGTWRVTHVVDGDTVDVVGADGRREEVRIIGIDTPERYECGFSEAGAALTAMVEGRQVTLQPGAQSDRDRYRRLLRYVDSDAGDAGLALIEQGLAIARYDSRDGYGRHPREDAYVAADAATPDPCGAPPPAAVQPLAAVPPPAPGEAWPSCSQAQAAGAAPVYRGDPGYGAHLDRDGDGEGCE